MRQTCARGTLVLAILAAILTTPGSAGVANAQNLDREVETALKSLYDTTPAARDLAATAKGNLMPAGTTEVTDGTMDTQAGTMDATSGTMAPRTTARPDTYVFVLGETGLMTGVGRQGWKITKAGP